MRVKVKYLTFLYYPSLYRKPKLNRTHAHIVILSSHWNNFRHNTQPSVAWQYACAQWDSVLFIYLFCTGTISDATPDVAIDCGTAESISTQHQNTRTVRKKAWNNNNNKKNINKTLTQTTVKGEPSKTTRWKSLVSGKHFCFKRTD